MKNIDTTTVGGRIKALRVAKGLSQEELAEMLFLNAKNISAYENNRNEVPSAVLAALADALDSDMDYIYRGIKKEECKELSEAKRILESLTDPKNIIMAMKMLEAIAESEK